MKKLIFALVLGFVFASSFPPSVNALAAPSTAVAAPAVAPGDGGQDDDHHCLCFRIIILRRLWTDHVYLTKAFIDSAVSENRDTTAVAARLIRNQDDIGRFFLPCLGRERAGRLTELLREHILIAAKVVMAAKAGNDEDLKKYGVAWTANADEISGFLHRANPRGWPMEALKSMMREHLEITGMELMMRLKGDYEGEIKAFDRGLDHILGLADFLGRGLIIICPCRDDDHRE